MFLLGKQISSRTIGKLNNKKIVEGGKVHLKLPLEVSLNELDMSWAIVGSLLPMNH